MSGLPRSASLAVLMDESESAWESSAVLTDCVKSSAVLMEAAESSAVRTEGELLLPASFRITRWSVLCGWRGVGGGFFLFSNKNCFDTDCRIHAV